MGVWGVESPLLPVQRLTMGVWGVESPLLPVQRLTLLTVRQSQDFGTGSAPGIGAAGQTGIRPGAYDLGQFSFAM